MTHLLLKAYIHHCHKAIYSSLYWECAWPGFPSLRGSHLGNRSLATIPTLPADFHLLCYLLTHQRLSQKAVFLAGHGGKPAVPELGG